MVYSVVNSHGETVRRFAAFADALQFAVEGASFDPSPRVTRGGLRHRRGKDREGHDIGLVLSDGLTAEEKNRCREAGLFA